MRVQLTCVAAVALVCNGCGLDLFQPRSCTAEIRPNFTFMVTDSLTGFGIAAQATGSAVTVGQEFDLVPHDSVRMNQGGIGEHPGTYTITIAVPGYRTWTDEVHVPHDGCHVVTQEVVAKLLPIAGSVTLFADSVVETRSATELPTTVALTPGAGYIVVSGTAGQSPRCPEIGVSVELWGRFFRANISHPDGCDAEPHHGITYRYVYPLPEGVYRAVVDDPWVGPSLAVDRVITIED